VGGKVEGMSQENHANEDLKAKMREALDRKNAKAKGVQEDVPLREKAHGSEVRGGAGPKMHRRKAGGGGS
jgi:hypothetical protein